MRSIDSAALSALETAAGVSPSHISVTIRTLFLVLIFFWAGACIYSEIHHFRHHAVDALDVLRKNTRILFAVVIAMILAFIS